MRTRDVARSNQEKRTFYALSRALEKRGYRVWMNMRLDEVLEREPEELGDVEAQVFGKMHFDFVVTKEFAPVFVVEFDGPQHQEDSTRDHLDAVKNKFCRDAGLPMLRISSQELEPHEGVDLVSWILERWIAWQTEGPRLWREITEEIEQQRLAPEDYTAGDIGGFAVLDPSYDPTVRFGIRHPYPAILTVAHRLHRLGIITHRADGRTIERLTSARPANALAQCGARMTGVRMGDPGEDEWQITECRGAVAPWDAGPTGQPCPQPLYATVQRVRMRWALPVGWNARDALRLPESHPFDLELIKTRMEHLWTCDLPGAWSSDIAEGLGEYLVLRDIERWARRHWPPSSS